MPKITISNDKGLVQSPGSGITVKSTGIPTQAWSASTSLILGSTDDAEMTLTQPANTVLVDAGFVLTTAIVGSSGTTTFKVGTSSDGAEICAAANLASSATAAAIGSGISLSGLNSEGAATLAIVADAPAFTSTSRTLYLRISNAAAITAGAGRSWITYMYLS